MFEKYIEKTVDVEYDLNHSDKESSVRFVNKLWSEFRELSNFRSRHIHYKNAKENKIDIAEIQLTNKTKTIVSYSYKSKEIIKKIFFKNISVDFRTKLDELIIKCNKMKNVDKFIVAFKFKTSFSYMQAIDFGHFTIQSIGGNSNLIILESEGYDYEDAILKVRNAVYKFVDCLSSLMDIAIYVIGDFREDFELDQDIKNVFEENDTSDGFYSNPILIAESDFDIISNLIDNKNFGVNYSEDPFWKSMKFIRDGLNIEFSPNKEIEISTGEVSHVLYMSALEVMAKEYLSDDSGQCNCCGQKVYAISKKSRDLVKGILKSDLYVSLAKDNYGFRSKFLHEGKYFNFDSLYFKYHVPNLQRMSEFVEESHIEYNDQRKVRSLVMSIIKRRIQHLIR